MPIRLYLIWGATTTGKTAQSVALARATGAPVISLDRVQCCQELAVGSGRPSPSDLLGTRREYLCDRSVSSGVIPAADANQLLFDKVVRYSAHERALILEGGSVSLINAMIRDERWSEQGEWALCRIALPGRAVFMAQAIKRVRDMLEPPPGHAGILDELGACGRIPGIMPSWKMSTDTGRSSAMREHRRCPSTGSPRSTGARWRSSWSGSRRSIGSMRCGRSRSFSAFRPRGAARMTRDARIVPPVL